MGSEGPRFPGDRIVPESFRADHFGFAAAARLSLKVGREEGITGDLAFRLSPTGWSERSKGRYFCDGFAFGTAFWNGGSNSVGWYHPCLDDPSFDGIGDVRRETTRQTKSGGRQWTRRRRGVAGRYSSVSFVQETPKSRPDF